MHDSPTVLDLQRLAAQALTVAPRLVQADSAMDIADHWVTVSDQVPTLRLRAVGGALVIQHLDQAESNPFCGLLVIPAARGHLPRLLYDMGALADGMPQLAKAERMLRVVVRRASLS